MSARDRTILTGVAVLAVVAAFWILALQPKLGSLSDAKKELSTAKVSLETARAEAAESARARLDFPQAYAQLARLGKSVPANTDQTSLVYQLEKAADRAGVKFVGLTLAASGGGAPAPAPVAGEGAGAQPASSHQELIGSVPADAVATAASPAGSTTGPAGLRVMHFTLDFEGSFFNLADFLREAKRMTWSRHKKLSISGRLVGIDSITLDTGGRHVQLNATTYLLPSGEGVFAGATPAGPATPGASQAASAPATPATPTAPPSATVGAR